MPPRERPLKPAQDTWVATVANTLAALDLSPQDAACARLAQSYAASLDSDIDGALLPTIGPKLLACLSELGATPKTRPSRGVVLSGSGRLAQLRAVRQR